jgi:hypothetical protein
MSQSQLLSVFLVIVILGGGAFLLLSSKKPPRTVAIKQHQQVNRKIIPVPKHVPAPAIAQSRPNIPRLKPGQAFINFGSSWAVDPLPNVNILGPSAAEILSIPIAGETTVQVASEPKKAKAPRKVESLVVNTTNDEDTPKDSTTGAPSSAEETAVEADARGTEETAMNLSARGGSEVPGAAGDVSSEPAAVAANHGRRSSIMEGSSLSRVPEPLSLSPVRRTDNCIPIRRFVIMQLPTACCR